MYKLRCQLAENQYPKALNYIQSSLAVNIHHIDVCNYYVYECQAWKLPHTEKVYLWVILFAITQFWALNNFSMTKEVL